MPGTRQVLEDTEIPSDWSRSVLLAPGHMAEPWVESSQLQRDSLASSEFGPLLTGLSGVDAGSDK